MENAELQFQDFFMAVNDEYKDFVHKVKERVLQEGYTIISIGTTKANPFVVGFTQPKTRRGIVKFYLRKRSFKMIISGKNCASYPGILSGLPEKMLQQIDKIQPCLNITTPGKCMDKCVGYDFYIGDVRHQKCRFGCFQFDVNPENIPFLMGLLEAELEERAKA